MDLHVHTIPTIHDSDFLFDLSILKKYVEQMHIDAIAITNHNIFDLDQYKSIVAQLSVVVFPGIEINVGVNCGHMLLIAETSESQDFNERCKEVENRVTSPKDSIDIDAFKKIFGDLEKYLLIPHYDKKPHIDKSILHELSSNIFCGEVNSVKKFIYNIKDHAALTPVYFSDMRASDALVNFPVRQTYFDLEDISLQSIKLCLRDKSKISLSEKEGHRSFSALPYLELSTGLNVIIGGRSSGKTYTLNQIHDRFDNGFENVKYIEQFSLLEANPEKEAKDFAGKLNIKRKSIEKEYYSEFSIVVDDVKDIFLETDEFELNNYLESLLNHASEIERADSFSKCSLYSESEFQTSDLRTLKDLIKAVQVFLDTSQYRHIISRFVDIKTLVNLFRELVATFIHEHQNVLKKRWTNDLVSAIKTELESNTAATRVPDVDFYKIQSNRMKIGKFINIVNEIRKPIKIYSQDLEGFIIEAKTKQFRNASELKNHSGKKLKFSYAFSEYQNPYRYLVELRKIEDLDETTYYQYFMDVEFRVLNQYGYAVSGGERAEFNLLQEINDARQYDLLLIDEPESSFDNLFLKDRVNALLKSIAKELPVIVVTHNSTVGASIQPDYLIYTKRNVSNTGVEFEIYSGFPTDKMLVSTTGQELGKH